MGFKWWFYIIKYPVQKTIVLLNKLNIISEDKAIYLTLKFILWSWGFYK